MFSAVPLCEQVDQPTWVVKGLPLVAAGRQAAQRAVLVAADYSSLVKLWVVPVVDKRAAQLAV
jgi:hypothetical protein